MLGWSQQELADKCGLSLGTVSRLETGDGDLATRFDTLKKLQEALESGGIEFTPSNGHGPGVRPRKKA